MPKFSKPIPAFKNTECDNCANEIEEEETFYYYNGEKFCLECKHEKIEELYNEEHSQTFTTKFPRQCNYCEDPLETGDEIILVASMPVCARHIPELENSMPF